MILTGECFCGSVAYEIAGTVRDARSCHCSKCRKAFSSQASSYALVEPDQFTWTRGQELLTTFSSGSGFGLQFCSKCGSTLCGVFNGQIHGITLGCLNDDPGIEIGRHIFVGSKASWEVIPDSVVQYAENSPEPESE
ncbi:GFA family protein [Pseudomonas sp. SJZ079]|uniref:GFA family protein n=1 Tax=Pseudomonas sp. SJZ079 TaxID=2572887 RepID=UPI0011BE804C